LIALVLAPSELLFGALSVIGLKTGVMQGRGGYSARRSEAPAVFWLIWALNWVSLLPRCSSRSGANEHEQSTSY
jgi:hypothetical protein